MHPARQFDMRRDQGLVSVTVLQSVSSSYVQLCCANCATLRINGTLQRKSTFTFRQERFDPSDGLGLPPPFCMDDSQGQSNQLPCNNRVKQPKWRPKAQW